MRVRGSWLALALVPALAGVVSFSVGTGDFRSSGLVAGIAATLGLLALLLLATTPWREATWLRRLLSALSVAVLGIASLFGLAAGLPEFLEELGFSVDVEAHGPRAVVVIDDGFVVVGNDQDGMVVWQSADGVIWSRVSDDPVLEELEVRDALVDDGELVAIGRPHDVAEINVLKSPVVAPGN